MVKGLTYRIASFFVGTVGMSYFFGKTLDITLYYSTALTLAGFSIWFTNEMLWRRTNWGKPSTSSSISTEPLHLPTPASSGNIKPLAQA